MEKERSFNSLVEQYLGMRLPDDMAAAISLPDLPAYAQDFIRRALFLMKLAGYTATQFTPALIRWLSATVPGTLPDAWGGRIPPLTMPNRHLKLDAYVSGQGWPTREDPYVFIDLGCGFPPVTSADTARNLPDWHIYGVDHSFGDFVLYDPNGHYACFDRKGVLLYFQAFMSSGGRALYADPQASKDQFNKLFADLFPLLPPVGGPESKTVEKDGNRLIRNHIRNFETDNLTLVKADMGNLHIPSAAVVRCMNVLLYFTGETQKKKLLQAGELLDEEGILIAGTSGLGIQSRYTVYRKGPDGLVPAEFAFSIDNFGHLVFLPWFTIHENDPEALLLAELAGTVRTDLSFWPPFSARLDALLETHGICNREPDGFLHLLSDDLPPAEYLKKNDRIWMQMADEGYAEFVSEVLRRAGHDAWINPVGDIAIRPPHSFRL
jgi:hypothetical protein